MMMYDDGDDNDNIDDDDDDDDNDDNFSRWSATNGIRWFNSGHALVGDEEKR